MVTVANSFEAPIKCKQNIKAHKCHFFCLFKKGYNSFVFTFAFTVVFPQDLLEKGFSASNFAMLGLGDIVIPGIFVALLLRFDQR